MRSSTPFVRRRVRGTAKAVTELDVEWTVPVGSSFFDRVLATLEPALDAADARLAQIVRGDRKSRPAKISRAKLAAALAGEDVDSLWLTGRPGRGYTAITIGPAEAPRESGGAVSAVHLHVEITAAPGEHAREIADGEIFAAAFEELMATSPERGFVRRGAEARPRTRSTRRAWARTPTTRSRTSRGVSSSRRSTRDSWRR